MQQHHTPSAPSSDFLVSSVLRIFENEYEPRAKAEGSKNSFEEFKKKKFSFLVS